jgi:formate hydrogenlyase subunit 3/multisubunit Na+/H+ antiporter MnhD subunit
MSPGNPGVGALFLALVAVAFLGMAGVLMPMLQGMPDPARARVPEPRLAIVAPLAALALLLLLGIWLPSALAVKLTEASTMLGGSSR